MTERKKLIKGVKIKKLNFVTDERGRLMEILREDDELFENFGQVYITTAYPGVTKAWHYHKKQTDNITVIKGMVKLVLYDSRDNSETKGTINEFFLGDYNTGIVKVPPMVFHGFKCISENEAIMLNIPTEPYNHESPDEFRISPHDNDIPYSWERKDS